MLGDSLSGEMEIHGLEEYFDLKDEGKEFYCLLAESSQKPVRLIAGGATITKNQLSEGVRSVAEVQVEVVEQELKRRRSRERKRDEKMRRGIRKTLSNNCEKLEHLFSSKIEVGSKKQRQYLNLLKFVMNFLMVQMKQVAPYFSKRVAEIYCGGSFFDGLKTDSQAQEFDMNVIFRFNSDYFHLCQLGDYKGKENFCYLRAGGTKGCPRSLRLYTDFISPLDMFNQLLSSVDRVISKNNHVIEYRNGLRYRITRSVGAPITLKVEGLDDNVEFEVDLVPAVMIPRQKLHQRQKRFQVTNAYRDTSSHIQSLRSQFGCTRDENNDVLAISLHKADKEKFELDFHDLERKMLKERGCVKKVIMLIKYLRDIQMGSMNKMWSHLIKVISFTLLCWTKISPLIIFQTTVMHLVLQTPKSFWDNCNLEECLMGSLENLLHGFEQDFICDVFFPKVIPYKVYEHILFLGEPS